ncbi:branched-chain amino acid ABC transporter ATP-binding protein/permease [Paraburkholderia sp. Cy-641]|uniref:branched-chain amino acid ABC transporter ATP-binding protein/permease n=1 Tax=Paraburkholderia sp. Cy-641 TaxID=2608337 RepID=UPI001F0455EE|nr:branched-chain amino acid ABC transporter ATP-binding protein/permease [Paraburkholderia sp. Cy-641]
MKSQSSSMLRHPILWLALVLAALSFGAVGLGIPLGRITEIAIYTLYAAGVGLLVGYTGLVPFGASVFFGCASYAVGIGMGRLFSNEIEALAFAIVFSLVLGSLVGLVILRRRGLYFSLLTLACSQIAYEIAFKWTDFTGGENGIQDVARPWLGSMPTFHAFSVVTIVLAMGFLWRLAHSPFGRVLQALRENEQRVSSLGYNAYRVKLAAFAMSAAVVGYAGGLLALLMQGVYANNLSWQHAGDALLMVVLGGVHQFLGPLWGAIGFVLLQDKLSAITENWWLLFAPIIVVLALASPEGIQGIAQRLLRRPRWTLMRAQIPARPAVIEPFRSAKAELDPGQPILSVRNLGKRFGSIVTAKGIDLDVMPYQLHSFIGPNGAGKTTFFNMLSGLLRPDTGEIVFEGRDVSRLPMFERVRLGLARSFQILSVFRELTAFENVRVAVQARSPLRHSIWLDAYRIDAINARTWTLLQAVGLEDRAEQKCANLSHGEQRLLEIAVSLATDAKLLLLDEPLAGLAEADREIVGKLIRRLASTHAVLLIEHDIDRVIALSDRLTVLHQGRLIADGKPHEVASHPDVISAYLGKSKDEDAAEALAPAGVPALAAREHDGRVILKIEKLCAGYDGSQVLDRLDMEIREGEVVALLGRNGVGKSTTLRAMMGVAQVGAGRVVFDGRDITHARPHEINRLGLSMVPEGRRLFPNLTVLENLVLAQRAGGASLDEVYELFPKLRVLQKSKAEALSGGERQMVAIARALMVPSRIILLDEPFEGLAPAVVKDIMDAVVKLRGRASLVIVEHHAESVLPMADRAYVMVNGQMAFAGPAHTLANDAALQARLLGVTGEPEAVG